MGTKPELFSVKKSINTHQSSDIEYDYSYIEKYISHFIEAKIAEKVYLSVKENYVGILPVSKRDSLMLSMFWMKVLRHNNNFPQSSVLYHTFKEPVSKHDKIYIMVEDIMIVVNLTTGSLEVEGCTAHTWFKRRMIDVLRRYIGYTQGGLQGELAEEAEMRQWEAIQNSKGRITIVHPDREFVTPMEQEHLHGVWTGDQLNMQLEALRSPCLRPSHSLVYRLWKSLLNLWLSQPTCTVYLASDEMDARRLRDLCDLCLLNKTTCQLGGLYLPFHCQKKTGTSGNSSRNTTTLSDIRHEANRHYQPDEQVWVQYKVFEWITSPLRPLGGVTFIAGVRDTDSEVDLLLTSAAFTAEFMDRETTCSVQYFRMSRKMFMLEFVQPIQAGVASDDDR